ncbi:MAG: tRNA (cytidine(34)-2'-O)-methyltransferase [Gammaproteobacteria bacterium]|jgi:tRNA (cytidine/uridine-2'-O-)-methyltransferase|nr:tRNA (cytidine(34)-2'-O)-methyltransferase [Gammaproteobacteria bacterium]
MFDVVLFQPEIPPNTGNIMRLCANTGVRLHLIEPLGFILDDRRLRRAGLDYREWAEVQVHTDFTTYLRCRTPPRVLACTTRGAISYGAVVFQPGDALLFGPETRGLPQDLIQVLPPDQRLFIPMHPGNRSLNLSNAVAVILYEAWRQQGFSGAGRI